MNTGYRIALLREQKGLSQKELANRLGVSKSTIGHWESGARRLQDEYIIQLADFFNVTTDYILGRKSLCEKQQVDIGIELDNFLSYLSTPEDVYFYGKALTESDKGNLKMALQMAIELNKSNFSKIRS